MIDVKQQIWSQRESLCLCGKEQESPIYQNILTSYKRCFNKESVDERKLLNEKPKEDLFDFMIKKDGEKKSEDSLKNK